MSAGVTEGAVQPSRPAVTRQWRGVVEEYREWLPLPAGTPTYTLREGGTPDGWDGWRLPPYLSRRGINDSTPYP